MYSAVWFAIFIVAVFFATIFVASFLFTPTDTLRDLRDLVDLRPFRNFLRSLQRYRPRFSLAVLLIGANVGSAAERQLIPRRVVRCSRFRVNCTLHFARCRSACVPTLL